MAETRSQLIDDMPLVALPPSRCDRYVLRRRRLTSLLGDKRPGVALGALYGDDNDTGDSRIGPAAGVSPVACCEARGATGRVRRSRQQSARAWYRIGSEIAGGAARAQEPRPLVSIRSIHAIGPGGSGGTW